MIALSICNHKGGTGKTTTTMHVAAALGLSGYRVLVIDLDPQGFLTRMLGVGEPSEAASALMLFQYETPLDEVKKEPLPGFDLLPSSSTLTKVMRKLNKPTDVLWTREALEDLNAYHIVLFDTAAAVTVYSLNALVASRYVLVPVTPEYQPVVGAEQTHRTASMVRDKLNPDLEPPLFLFTQVDARKRNHHRYRHYLRKHYGDRVMESVIRTSASLSTSHSDGTTVFEHDPYSRGARDYANATDELLAFLQSREALAPVVAEDDAPPPAAEVADDRAQPAAYGSAENHASAEDGDLEAPRREDAPPPEQAAAPDSTEVPSLSVVEALRAARSMRS